MKIFISVDWEGVAGVVSWSQEDQDGAFFRKLMTYEVNAAIEGAIRAGAAEITVNDSHGNMRNLLLEEVHPKARVITGGLKELSMVQGITEDMSAAIFIGYHAQAGTRNAVLDHSYSGGVIHGIRVNGQKVGETSINAAVCGYFGVPLVAVSGDDALEEEVRWLGAKHIVVKEAQSRYCAKHLHPSLAREAIQDGVEEALRNLREYHPLVLQKPVTIEMDVFQSAMTIPMMGIPGMKQVSDRTVSFTHEDWLVVFKAFLAAIALGGTVKNG